MTKNEEKIILDLCGGTGSWSKPYLDAGYDVRNITLPQFDVRLFELPKEKIYGILSAPPCDHFAGSGARWWKSKGENKLKEGLSIVDACLRIIISAKPFFWALENPVGRLYRWLGKPKLIFNPSDFGEPYTKKTCLWGEFNTPTKNPVEAPSGEYNKIHYPRDENGKPIAWNSPKAKELRSITPMGFAKAFFEANR
jgi:hypothetical protein